MSTYTLVHVAISLIGIFAGVVAIYGFVVGLPLKLWNWVFLVFTILTSVTGFFFPIERFTPALALGILSLVVLAPALASRYYFELVGPWRRTYVITAMIAQYLNVFVLIAQSFQKIPLLRELAPTQSEPPFAVAQFIALVAFVALGVLAAKRFRAQPGSVI